MKNKKIFFLWELQIGKGSGKIEVNESLIKCLQKYHAKLHKFGIHKKSWCSKTIRLAFLTLQKIF